MATKCSNCGQPLEGDFGLVECAHCGTMALLESTDSESANAAPVEQVAFVQPQAPQPDPPPEFVAPESELESLDDVAEFGNSDTLSRPEGSLRYRIEVSGVDSPELRALLREALMDKRFMWDVEDLLKGIRAGGLKLSDLSPVKAHLIISRLQATSLDIVWEQYNEY